jgi:hypothetical protein
MNLAATIALSCGGPGSGCVGPNCGRKGQGDKEKDLKEVMEFHDFIKHHPFRGDIGDLDPQFSHFSNRLAKFQDMQVRSLASRVQNLAEQYGWLDDFTKDRLKASVVALDEAESLMAKEQFGLATVKQDAALNTLHFLIGSFQSQDEEKEHEELLRKATTGLNKKG